MHSIKADLRLRASRRRSLRELPRLVPLVLALAALGGCGGPPQAAPHNQRLISSLRTALSAQNPQWLEQNIAEIEQRRAEGKMGDDEYEAFRAIVALAQEGEWKEAEVEAVRYQQAQRPTPEQIDRLPKLRE